MHPLLPLLCVGILSLPASAAEKDRTLSLPIPAGSHFKVDAGAGYLKVEGREGQGTIEVQAKIVATGLSEKDLEELIQTRVELILEKTADGARLKADVKQGGARSWFSFGDSARIDLIVTVPKALRLTVHDGSGTLDVLGIRGDVAIEDGSGELNVRDIQGNLTLEDGSGGIVVKEVTGDVKVDDGSGAMEILSVGGTVTVQDGSGSITIDGVGRDVVLKSVGSGGVHTRNVKGRVTR